MLGRAVIKTKAVAPPDYICVEIWELMTPRRDSDNDVKRASTSSSVIEKRETKQGPQGNVTSETSVMLRQAEA